MTTEPTPDQHEAAEAPQEPVPEVEALPAPNPEALQAELQTTKDQLLRALADQENMRRRLQRDKEEAGRFAIANFARDLLNVADNLRRALDNVPPELREGAKVLIEGVEMTERELLAAFERHGVKRIKALGERFNYDLHQAMFELEDGKNPPGTVVQELQPGYTLHDRLLRPAMVGVSKGKPAAEQPTGGHVDTQA